MAEENSKGMPTYIGWEMPQEEYGELLEKYGDKLPYQGEVRRTPEQEFKYLTSRLESTKRALKRFGESNKVTFLDVNAAKHGWITNQLDLPYEEVTDPEVKALKLDEINAAEERNKFIAAWGVSQDPSTLETGWYQVPRSEDRPTEYAKAKGGLVETGPKLIGEPTYKSIATGLGTLGRYGDNYMVHASDGETVVPGDVLEANPPLKEALFQQMRMMGVEDPNRYVVGNDLNSINPVTGQPEFFFKKLFKKILPIAAPIIGNLILPGMGGPIASALATKLTGGSTKDALMAGLVAGGSQALMGGIGGMGKNGVGFMKGAQSSLGQMFRSPSAAWQQGIFGGGTLGSAYGATMGSKPIPGVAGTSGTSSMGPPPPYQKASAITQTQLGDLTNPSQTYRPIIRSSPGHLDMVTGYDAATELGVGQVGKTPGGNWFSDLGPWGKAGLIGGGLGLGALALGAFDEEEDEEGSPAGDPRIKAYDKFLALSTQDQQSSIGQGLLKQAGVGPLFNAQQIADATGISLPEALAYLGQYGITETVAARGGAISGPGTGTSDDIPARLSDGEFVMTADAVRGAGNGNRQRGAARMYDMMHQFERVA